MSPLREIIEVRQIPGEYARRWFSSESMDLFVWLGASGGFAGFQFTYDKNIRERALSWTVDAGFSHDAVDDGDTGPRKSTPILRRDGAPDTARVIALLESCGDTMPADVLSFVIARVGAYPG